MADIKNSAPLLVSFGASDRGISARSAEVSLALEKSVRKGGDDGDGDDGDGEGAASLDHPKTGLNERAGRGDGTSR